MSVLSGEAQLLAFGVSDVLADPQLTLRLGNVTVETNDDWAGNNQVSSVGSAVRAFPFASTASKDAALFRQSLLPGAYTMQVIGTNSTTGVGLAEIYDATPIAGARTGPRLINLSSRAFVGPGNDVLIAGFVIAGATAKTVLIRGIGSGLTFFGVPNALPAGELSIFDSNGKKIAENLSPTPDGVIYSIAQKVGAAISPTGSNDNGIVLTLPPGGYTVQLRGVKSASGVALIEVYEVP